MKLALILILVIQINLIKSNTVQNDASSESKVATSKITNNNDEFIMTQAAQTEKHVSEKGTNKRTKFVITRRPPVNVHRSKSQRVKKIPSTIKIHNRHKTAIYIRPKKLSRVSHKEKPVFNHKKHTATKSNKDVNNSIANKINATEILNEYKKKQTIHKDSVCDGPEMMNIIYQARIVGGKEKVILNSSNLKDLRKLRKCLLRLKGLENAVSNNKRKHKRVKSNGNFKSNDKDVTVNSDSSEHKLNGENLQFANKLRNKPVTKSQANEGEIPTENIDHSLTKRQINIIEEESFGTTSSGFKFTGRDLLHSQFMYRNIHN